MHSSQLPEPALAGYFFPAGVLFISIENSSKLCMTLCKKECFEQNNVEFSTCTDHKEFPLGGAIRSITLFFRMKGM